MRYALGHSAFFLDKMKNWQNKRLLILLPLRESGGGSHVIVHEALALQRLGVDVCLLNFSGHQQDFERCYPALALPVHYVEQVSDIATVAMTFDVVMATVYFTVDWLAPLAKRANAPALAYYIQDFEPWFFADKLTRYRWFWRFPRLRRRLAGFYFRRSADFRCAWLSYLQPNFKLLTKTRWNQAELLSQVGKQACLVGASYAQNQFKPAIAKTHQPALVISAMIRPASPRRAASHTMQVLKHLKQRWQDKIDIRIFGVDAKDPDYLALEHDFSHQNLGILSQAQVADLFAHSDIFADFSYFQAMGLTAMEAMAMGVTVICPQIGGASSFAKHQHNAYLVDSHSEKACLRGVEILLKDKTLRQRLAQQAQRDIQAFSSDKAAKKIAACLWGQN